MGPLLICFEGAGVAFELTHTKTTAHEEFPSTYFVTNSSVPIYYVKN